MALTGAAVAYTVIGGLVLYSGVKGATIADTVRSALKGNLTVTDTESAPAAAGSASATASGSGDANYLTIGKYLAANGYSRAAAAGIVGCVAGESAGNPESVGAGSYGIIQEQGQQYAGLVTGDPSADLNTQLGALVAYNNAQGAGLVAMLNSFTDPVQAAYFYSESFERPKVKDSDVVASVATQVFGALQ